MMHASGVAVIQFEVGLLGADPGGPVSCAVGFAGILHLSRSGFGGGRSDINTVYCRDGSVECCRGKVGSQEREDVGAVVLWGRSPIGCINAQHKDISPPRLSCRSKALL